MKNNSFGSGIVAVIVCFIVIGFIGMALGESEPRCIKWGCDNAQVDGSSYCSLHKPSSLGGGSGYDSSNSTGYGSTNSYEESGKESDYDNSSGSSGNSGSSSSSDYSGKSNTHSDSSKHYTQDTYDEGYEAVYDDDDYDMDRYLEDDDYASGVDDAMGDLEDEGESDW